MPTGVFSSSLSPRETNAKDRDFGTKEKVPQSIQTVGLSLLSFSYTSSKLGPPEPVLALSEAQLLLRRQLGTDPAVVSS